MSLTLVRKSCRGILQSQLRGPKKTGAGPTPAKKGKGKGAAVDSDQSGDLESSHIFNIFAGVPDPTVQDDSFYPKWLWSLADPPKTYSELSSTFIYGVNIESASEIDYKRFLRQHRKLVIKLNNARLKKSKSPPEDKIRFP
jgi:large subunit ribosomal protein L54